MAQGTAGTRLGCIRDGKAGIIVVIVVVVVSRLVFGRGLGRTYELERKGMELTKQISRVGSDLTSYTRD